MRFVKSDDLVKGMRLAKPIYNKNGVLLYDRDTKLTKQGINSIKNFNLIGIYILEPAEPLPPMTDDDVEFERFQTMSVFGLKEDLEIMISGKKPVNIDNLVKIISKNYTRIDQRVNFTQNIRSQEDYVYKHSLNVAILTAMMGVRMKLTAVELRYAVYTALVHDLGKLTLNMTMSTQSMSEDTKNNIIQSELKGIKIIEDSEYATDEVKNLLKEKYKLEKSPQLGTKDKEISVTAKILQVAEVYDDLTSMKVGEEPTSDVVAVRTLLHDVDKYDTQVVGALVDSIKILYPGVCVELTNGYTGLVIKGNKEDVLKPIILCFNDNNIYNLNSNATYDYVQIKDIMKSMDKRVVIDKNTIDEYMKKYN
jgi:5'-deoxynucleotidase YfbR-like HD superfamily hydrolase